MLNNVRRETADVSGVNEAAHDIVHTAQAQAEFSGKLTLGLGVVL